MNDSNSNPEKKENEVEKTFEDYFVESGADKLNAASDSTAIGKAISEFILRIKEVKNFKRTLIKIDLENHLKAIKIDKANEIVRSAFKEEEEKNKTLPESDSIEVVVPWDEDVSGEEVLREIENIINRFVVLPEALVKIISLFIMASYFLDEFDLFPILHISSPTKSCGKSNLIEILCSLSQRGELTADISYAAVFRAVDSRKITLCLDEIDVLFKKHPELEGFINASYSRKLAAGFTRYDTETNKDKKYNAWGSKIVAGIADIKNDTTRSRSIKIELQKKSKVEKVERFKSRKIDGITYDTTRKLVKFAEINVGKVREIMDQDPYLPEELDDRPANNFEPLFAVADLIGEETGKEIRRLAVEMMASQREEDSTSTILLLQDIREIFKEVDSIHTYKIVELLKSKEERPWSAWNKGQGIDTNYISRTLKGFGIKSKTMRIERVQRVAYKKEWFKDAFLRYLEPEVAVNGCEGVKDREGETKEGPSHPNPLEDKGNNEQREGVTEETDPPDVNFDDYGDDDEVPF